MKAPSPVFIDGTLYVCIVAFAFIQNYFTSDDSYKYVSPYFLFWMKFAVGLMGTIAGALKMFRSTSYSDHLKEGAVTPPPPRPAVDMVPLATGSGNPPAQTSPPSKDNS